MSVVVNTVRRQTIREGEMSCIIAVDMLAIGHVNVAYTHIRSAAS